MRLSNEIIPFAPIISSLVVESAQKLFCLTIKSYLKCCRFYEALTRKRIPDLFKNRLRKCTNPVTEYPAVSFYIRQPFHIY